MLHLLINRTKEIGLFMVCLMTVKIISSLYKMDDYIDFFGSLLGAIMAAGILTIPIVGIVSILDLTKGKIVSQ